MSAGADFRYVSKPRRTKEDRRFIAGEGRFAADVRFADLLHVAMVSSPYPCADIRSIETGAALAAPGSITVGATFGSTSQFYWLILENLTGMKFKFVPYDGTRERMTALLSGAIQMGGLNVASGRKYLEGGELKGFAIAAAKRSKHLPDMPTLSELGVDMIYALDRGIVVPKGTPADKIEHWAQLFKKAAADPDLRKQMDAKGTEVNWVGPAGYRECAQKTFAAHEDVAIKIGLWKKN